MEPVLCSHSSSNAVTKKNNQKYNTNCDRKMISSSSNIPVACFPSRISEKPRHSYFSDKDESLTEYASLPSPRSSIFNRPSNAFTPSRLSCFGSSNHPTARDASTICEFSPQLSLSRTFAMDENRSSRVLEDEKKFPPNSPQPTPRMKRFVYPCSNKSEDGPSHKLVSPSLAPGCKNLPHVEISPSFESKELLKPIEKCIAPPGHIPNYINESSDCENCPPETVVYDVSKHFSRSLCLSPDVESRHYPVNNNSFNSKENQAISQSQTRSHGKNIPATEDDLTFRYLLDERDRLQNKLNYIKLTSKAYRMRLTTLDSNIKLVRSLASTSNRSLCERSPGSHEFRTISDRQLSCKACSCNHSSSRESAISEL